jgi:exonuclease III
MHHTIDDSSERNIVCILDTNTSPLIPHTTATLATTDRLDWIDNPSNSGTSWNKVDLPQKRRPTVCIPDTNNTPWNNYAGENITDWINDADNNKISWNDIHSITDNTTVGTSTTSMNINTHDTTILCAPLADDDSFDDINATNNNDHETPPPPPTTTAAAVTHHPHPSFPHQFDISTFSTQNTHGLRRLPRDANGKLMTTEPYDYTRYKHLISMLKTKSLDVYFVQGTWLEGDAFNKVINSYHVFRHNGGKDNHNFQGVAIILSPRYYQGWKAAGARPPLTADAAGEFAGRYISINVIFKSYDRMGKQVRGKKENKHLAITLASVYHPCTKTGAEDVYACFLDTLNTLLSKLTADNEIIMGADVNANIGKFDKLQSSEFQSSLGPHGFSKRNSKGEDLLTVYLAHRLCVMNTFFESRANGPGYGTWTSNQPTSTGLPESHMLDLIVCSTTLHKRLKNCQVTNDGIDSDHQAV